MWCANDGGASRLHSKLKNAWRSIWMRPVLDNDRAKTNIHIYILCMYMYVLPKIFKYLWNIERRDKCFEFARNAKFVRNLLWIYKFWEFYFQNCKFRDKFLIRMKLENWKICKNFEVIREVWLHFDFVKL